MKRKPFVRRPLTTLLSASLLSQGKILRLYNIHVLSSSKHYWQWLCHYFPLKNPSTATLIRDTWNNNYCKMKIKEKNCGFHIFRVNVNTQNPLPNGQWILCVYGRRDTFLLCCLGLEFRKRFFPGLRSFFSIIELLSANTLVFRRKYDAHLPVNFSIFLISSRLHLRDFCHWIEQNISRINILEESEWNASSAVGS